MTDEKKHSPWATVWPVVVRIAAVITALGGGAYGVDYTVDATEERAGQAAVTTAHHVNKQREAILALREENVTLREKLLAFAKKDRAHDVAIDALVHLAEKRHGARKVDRTFATFESAPPPPEHVIVDAAMGEGEGEEGEGEDEEIVFESDDLEALPESYEMLQMKMPAERPVEE
jgi:hypothetical protein